MINQVNESQKLQNNEQKKCQKDQQMGFNKCQYQQQKKNDQASDECTKDVKQLFKKPVKNKEITNQKWSYNSSQFSKLDSKNTTQRHELKQNNIYRYNKKGKNSKCQQKSREKLQDNNESKNSNKNLKTNIAMSIINSRNNYVNFSMTKTQPELSRMSFPYFLDDIQQDKQEQGKMKKMRKEEVKVTNRVFTNKKQFGKLDYLNYKLSSEQPPVNQYLCYDLSKQINNGLYEVRILAQEIKKIKKQKQQILQDKQKYKPKNKIKISKAYNGLVLSNHRFKTKQANIVIR